MTIHIEKLKVRPRKGMCPTFLDEILYLIVNWLIAAQTVMCATQLTAMLSCWAASGDFLSVQACQEHAENLHNCMRRTVCFPCP